MKFLLTPIFLLVFSLSAIRAQVLETTQVMATGSQPALTIILPGADTKLADATWKEYMKSYGKVAKVKGGRENIASQVQILDIGGVNRINVYSQSEEVAEGAKMVVWIDMGSGFVTSEAYPKEYVASVKFLKDFAHEVEIQRISNELEAQNKLLSKAESTLEKLKRENDTLHKIIEDSKKRITEAEKDIETNLKNQELAQKELGAQEKAVEEVQKKLDDAKKN
jgi:molecular chaperone DnaK (HSP70)